MTDIDILKPLAYEYFEASQSRENDERRILHRAVNDLRMIRPVVLIEEIPFHELNFDGSLTLKCEDGLYRGVENFLRQKLFHWKYFPGDMILTPYYPVGKIVHSTGIGIGVDENVIVKDKNNHIISHEYHDILSTEEELAKVQIPTLSYDAAATKATAAKIGEAVGDILPVRIVGQSCYMSMWDNIARYRGVTPLLLDLAERPEFSHKVIAKFTEIEASLSEQKERLGLFEPNPTDIHCTCALSSELPGNSPDGVTKRSQVWGRGMAQIFASVSKEMHREFDINYMKELMRPFGLNYYGCCEPLDKKIDLVAELPNLRKISITPWADVDIAAEAIGKKYVLANKPNPAAVATTLDTDELRREISRTLAACRRNGCSCDIVLKDISSVGYKLENLVEWEKTVMDMVRSW